MLHWQYYTMSSIPLLRQRAMSSASPTLTLETLTALEYEWFIRFKWEHPASPHVMQQMMAQQFGEARAEELVVFFSKTPIPRQQGEWRRRMH